MPSKTRKVFKRIHKYPTPNYGDSRIKTKSPKLSWEDMGKKKLETAAKEWLEGKTIPELLTQAQKLAEKLPQAKGVTGTNLQRPANRNITLVGQASGNVTNSASMFAFRKPRKQNEDMIQYAMKTNVRDAFTSTSGYQAVYDINVLDAEPVYDNPDSNDKYSNLTIRNAFDRYLRAQFKYSKDSVSTEDTARIQQTSIHVKSLTMDLVFTNLENKPVMIDLYELVPQHNLGPTTYNSSTSNAVGYMSPRWTYDQGLVGTSDVIEVQDDLERSNPASNPYNSTVFSRTWKEVKRVRINMTANSVHRHKAVYSINKTVSYQEMAQFSTSGGKFAGWNPTFMVVQKGVPTADSVADTTNVAYACNMQLNYSANPDVQAKVIVFDDKT